jgi:hypothetical protein
MQDNQLINKKNLFWLTVLAVSIHSQLDLLHLGLWQVSTLWWRYVAKLFTLRLVHKKEKKEGSGVPTLPSRACPQ